MSKPVPQSSGNDEIPRAGPESPPPGHQDAVTDITLIKATHWLTITSSRDGIIKVWK